MSTRSQRKRREKQKAYDDRTKASALKRVVSLVCPGGYTFTTLGEAIGIDALQVQKWRRGGDISLEFARRILNVPLQVRR